MSRLTSGTCLAGPPGDPLTIRKSGPRSRLVHRPLHVSPSVPPASYVPPARPAACLGARVVLGVIAHTSLGLESSSVCSRPHVPVRQKAHGRSAACHRSGLASPSPTRRAPRALAGRARERRIAAAGARRGRVPGTRVALTVTSGSARLLHVSRRLPPRLISAPRRASEIARVPKAPPPRPAAGTTARCAAADWRRRSSPAHVSVGIASERRASPSRVCRGSLVIVSTRYPWGPMA